MAELRFNIQVEGAEGLAEKIKNAVFEISNLSGPLVEEAEEIRAASMEIVPVDQGILRNSALEVGINVEPNPLGGVSVAFGYGGAAASYSIKQHETPPSIFKHTEGKTWKYLERPVLEAAAGMEGRLAAKMVARIEGALRVAR